MNRIFSLILTIPLTWIFFLDQAVCARPGTMVKPLYTLSNFSGHIPYNIVRLAVDQGSGEVFVLDLGGDDIRIFNRNGMEIYRTEPYGYLGHPVDLAVKDGGTIDLLVKDNGHYTIHRCNYRGEPVSEMLLTGIPEDFSDMMPDRILWNDGLMYLADFEQLKVTVFNDSGRYVRGYQIHDILDLEEKQANESSMFGFTVDREGNLLFTIPTLFSVYRVSPGGEVNRFGEAGSSPGKFSIVSGIAVGYEGYIYMTDRNRSVVMIYSPELKFLYEFGHRGFGPGNLIVPGDLVLDRNGRLYVTQMRKRGIQVYRVMLADGSYE